VKAILYRGPKREIEIEINIRPNKTGIYKTGCRECGGTGWWNYAYPEEEGECVDCKGTGQIYITC